MKVRVGEKAPLIRNVLFLEGITRAGKFLLANLLGGFKRIEPIQYKAVIEHIPYLVQAGLIERHTAKQMLRCEVDFHSYEMFIGRNFNLRREDKSAIYNHPDYKMLLKRSESKPREKLVDSLLEKKVYSTFILHETMPNIGIIVDTFPEAKILSIRRDPVDLAFSWYQRELGKRWGHDPVLFQISFHSKSGPVPWFARSWSKEYYAMNELDRVLKSILYLWQASEATFVQLPEQHRKQILRIKYEEVLEKPKEVVKSMSYHLNVPILPRLQRILKHERLPNFDHTTELRRKEIFLRKEANSRLFEQLLELRTQYQATR